MVSFSPKSLILALSLLGGAKAHGLVSFETITDRNATSFMSHRCFLLDFRSYLKSPRSRNFVAFEDGKESGTASDPAKEYCPQCLNRGGPLATCGLVEESNHNYDQPLNALGGPMPTNIQGSFAPGSEIEVDVVLTAHHKGHFEFYACAIGPGETPTDNCFKQHPLAFLQDPLYGAPKDPNYPHRAMIPPRDFPGILMHQGAVPGTFHRHRLPARVNLLAYHLWRANRGDLVFCSRQSHVWVSAASREKTTTLLRASSAVALLMYQCMPCAFCPKLRPCSA